MTMRIGCWQSNRACGRFLRDCGGATSVYGLIAVLIAIGMLAGPKALGAGNNSSWSSTSNKITNAMKDRAP